MGAAAFALLVPGSPDASRAVARACANLTRTGDNRVILRTPAASPDDPVESLPITREFIAELPKTDCTSTWTAPCACPR